MIVLIVNSENIALKKKNKSDKHSYILTKETLGATVLLFCLILTIILFTDRIIFLGFGRAVCSFMYGTFGYGAYIVVALMAYLGEWLMFEKRIRIKLRHKLCFALTLAALFLLFHSVTTRNYSLESFGGYLGKHYSEASLGYSGYTLGGAACGMVVYSVAKWATFTGAYVIFSVLSAAMIVLDVMMIRNTLLGKAIADANRQEETSGSSEDVNAASPVRNADTLYTVNEDHEIVANPKSEPNAFAESAASSANSENSEEVDRFSPEKLGRKILFENGEFAAESYRRNMIYNENSYFNHPRHTDEDYMHSFSSGTSQKQAAAGNSYVSDYSQTVENSQSSSGTPSYVYGDAPVQNLTPNTYPDSNPYKEYEYKSEEKQNYTEEIFDKSEDFYGQNKTEDRNVPSEVRPYFANEESSQPYAVPSPANTCFEQSVKDVQPEQEVRQERQIFQPVQPDRSAENNFREQSTPFIGLEEQPSAGRNVKEQPSAGRNTDIYKLFNASNPRLKEDGNSDRIKPVFRDSGKVSGENIFDGDPDNLFGDEQPLSGVSPRVESSGERKVGFGVPQPPVRNEIINDGSRNAVQPASVPASAAEEKPKHVWKKYVRPPIDLLSDYPENNNINTAEIEESKQIICETLANFRIDSRISNVVVGPAITRYDVIIVEKTNIKNALKYRDAIAMALMKENVTAYLNYAKGAISIEVPNSKRTVVGLKGMIASSQFINAKPNSLTFALGKNVEGQVVCPDITKMPHLLVAGTTGSGKSICLSALIISLLYKYGPEELRFILVDPKQVEFISYDKLPHLMINEIIYDVDKAIKALNWAIKEMERRYQLFKEMTESGVATKNLSEYNAHLPEGEEKLPKIVIILDEFGDLMLQAKKDIEGRIIRLVQKARACGIHLILATQRPSVDCITGLIKSNLPTRIGFKVNSFDDARCIFDIGGAEKLLGKGDLYFRSAESPELARIQGCFIDTPEVQKVTDYIKQHNETYFDQSVSDFINKVEEPVADSPADDGAAGEASRVDDTFIKALWFCVTSNQASVSMIQRRFPIGYMKACKIIDWMEVMNYVTQSEGSKPRKVLLSRDEFIEKYGDIDD